MPNFRETRACTLHRLIETDLSTKKNLLFYTALTSQQSFLAGTTKDWIQTIKKTTNPRLSFVYWEHIYELAEQMLQTR